ncbi:MAG: HAD family phosphatase [Cyanobacteria bacterium J06632_3]
MALKVVIFSFNGIIINDDAIRQQLIDQLLLAENLRPDEDDYAQVCWGRSDRACLKALLAQRGRSVTDSTLDKLLAKKTAAYQAWLQELESIPLYPGLDDLIFRCRAADIKMAVVTGTQRQDIESVLAKANLAQHFPIMVTGDDVSSDGSKPAPDGYLQVIKRLNEAYPDLNLSADECIAVEDSFAGIEAAQAAAIPVVGVAHVYPNHMLQRRADWVVDYLREIKFDWIGERFGGVPGVTVESDDVVSDETTVGNAEPDVQTESE